MYHYIAGQKYREEAVTTPYKYLTANPRKPKQWSSIIAKVPRHSYQIDIMDYSRRMYQGYRYILTCIDVYSRFALAEPLKSRVMSEVVPALRKIFSIMGAPTYINADQEFNTKVCLEFFKESGVKHVFFSQPYETNKNAIVKRFHRTLVGLLMKLRYITKSVDWPNDLLLKAIEIYNTKVHSTIQAIPMEVFLGENINKQEIIYPSPVKLEVGDVVTGPKTLPGTRQPTFAKGDVIKREFYTVSSIDGQKVYVRTLKVT
jgi:hypothetical protein